MIPSKEDKLRPVLERLTGTRAAGLLKFHDDHIKEILVAKGSSHNHQNWTGGYHDHLVHCFILAQDLYRLFTERIGPGPYPSHYSTNESGQGYFDDRPFPFSLENAIIVLYLHDIEKIFKYGLSQRYPARLVASKDAWYLGILPEKYNVILDEQEYNALKYIHGEGNDYRSDERVAGPLAGFVHSIDNLSARVLHKIRDFDHGFVQSQK